MKTTLHECYIDDSTIKTKGMKASIFIAASILISACQASAVYFQSFETDTAGWVGATRVMSGTHGVASKIGAFHAEDGGGAFTRWGGLQQDVSAGRIHDID